VAPEWEHRIADVIVDALKGHKYPKLISQNTADKHAKVVDPHSAISIFNFHFAVPPNTVAMNWQLNKVIGTTKPDFAAQATRLTALRPRIL
jgi:hypothetical protein